MNPVGLWFNAPQSGSIYSESSQASQAPSSEYSSLSDSQLTSSTVPGPGALTGKAIKALGKLTLCGLERIIIYARLKAILSRFPHTDNQAATIKKIDKLYDLTLELSRPGLYDEGLRARVLNLIVSQINTGHTHHLVQALGRWHTVEMELFFSGMIHQTGPVIVGYTLFDGYDSSLLPLLHSAKLVLLMSRVALTHRLACQAVLEAGFLDFLLWIDDEKLPASEMDEVHRTVFCISRAEFYETRFREQAFKFLMLSVSKSRPSLIVATALWRAQDVRIFVDTILCHFAPHWYSAQRGVESSTTEPQPAADRVLIRCIVYFLSRVAHVSGTACQAAVQAGFLDLLLLLQAHQFSIRRIDEKFDIVVTILKEDLYTEAEKSKAADSLIFQVSEGHSHTFYQALGAWNRQELSDLLRLLVRKLRVIVAREQQDTQPRAKRSIALLISFIVQVVLFDNGVCESVLDAGFSDILLATQRDSPDPDTLNMDILSRPDEHPTSTIITKFARIRDQFSLSVVAMPGRRPFGVIRNVA